MPRLSSLYIQNTAITDAGNRPTRQFQSLDARRFRVPHHRCVGPNARSHVTRLSTLYVRRTQLSPAALQAIQTQIPARADLLELITSNERYVVAAAASRRATTRNANSPMIANDASW